MGATLVVLQVLERGRTTHWPGSVAEIHSDTCFAKLVTCGDLIGSEHQPPPSSCCSAQLHGSPPTGPTIRWRCCIRCSSPRPSSGSCRHVCSCSLSSLPCPASSLDAPASDCWHGAFPRTPGSSS